MYETDVKFFKPSTPFLLFYVLFSFLNKINRFEKKIYKIDTFELI